MCIIYVYTLPSTLYPSIKTYVKDFPAPLGSYIYMYIDLFLYAVPYISWHFSPMHLHMALFVEIRSHITWPLTYHYVCYRVLWLFYEHFILRNCQSLVVWSLTFTMHYEIRHLHIGHIQCSFNVFNNECLSIVIALCTAHDLLLCALPAVLVHFVMYLN